MSDSKKIGYIRSSKKEKSADAFDQATQLMQHGADVLFADTGVSGFRLARDRHGFNRMLMYLDHHPIITQLWVTDMSRLGLSQGDVRETIMILAEMGVGVFSISEPHLLQTIVDGLSLFVQAGLKQAEEQILYRNDRETGARWGRPPRVVSREAVELMHKNGMTWRSIAQRLGCSALTIKRRRNEWKKQDALPIAS